MLLVQTNTLLIAGLTSLLWGLTGIFVRLLPALPPLTVTAGRLLVALLVILPILGLVRSARQQFASILAHPIAYTLALLLTGYYLLATTAFQLAPVAEVALLLSTPPLFVLSFRRIRHDIPSRTEVSGALLAVLGICLILAPALASTGESSINHLIGNILAVCAAGLTAIYAYTYRLLHERGTAPETIGVSLLTFVSGSAVLVLMVIFSPTPAMLETLTGKDLLIFLGIGVFSTAIPSLGFAIASSHLPAVVTATTSLLIPLFAGLFAFLILGETLSPMFIPGGFLVLAGIAMIIHHGTNKS